MDDKYFDFHNINENGSENVEYDLPELPLYIRDGNLSALKNYTFEAHYHTDWEFIAVLSGKMNYTINAETIELSDGEGLFVNSNHIHFGFSKTQSDCNYICILVHPSIFCTNPYIERNYIYPIINDGAPYLILKNAETDKRITDTIIHIYNKKQLNDKSFYIEVQQYLFSIVADLYKMISNSTEPRMSYRSFDNIKLMMDFISKNYQEKISLSDIAKSANICENACISIFKSFTNSTPKEYLTNYRINCAARLLAATDKPISQIALDCGFSGSSYFAEIFKRIIGKTPREFREDKL